MKTLLKTLSTVIRGEPQSSDSPPASAASLALARAKLEVETRLHLGCGTHLLNGWANVDLCGPAPVIQLDLTHPLPARSDAFDFVYCEHFIEHITLEQAGRLVSECHRVLRKDGVFRVSTPSLEKLVDEYRGGRLEEWQDVKWKPQTSCQLINEGMRLWGHQFVYDRPELTRLLKSAGFRRIDAVAWQRSEHPALQGLECRPFHDEIILECSK